MGATDIKIRIGANDDEFQRRLKIMKKNILRISRQMEEVGKKMSVAISAPIAALGAKSIDSLSKVDKLKKGLEGMMGSAEAANKEFAKLRDIAKGPGLNLDSVVNGSIQLQAVGFSANKASAAIKVFGNAVALAGKSGEDLAGVNLAITQIISKGKVQAEEINQIAERLPQVRKAMQDAFGTADTEVLQKMGLSAEEFVDKLTLELTKLPEAQRSVKDMLQKSWDDITVMFASLGETLTPVIKKVSENISKLSKFIENLNPEAKRFIVILGGVLAVAGPLIAALGGIGIAATAVSVAMSPVSLTIAAIVAAIGGLVAVGIWVKDNWSEMPNFFKRTFAQIYNFAVEMGEKLFNVIAWPLRKVAQLLGKEIPKASYDFAKIDVPERKYKTMKETLLGVSKEMKGLTDLTKGFNKEVDKSLFSGDYTRTPKGGGVEDTQKRRSTVSVTSLNGGWLANIDTSFLKSFKKIQDTSKDVATRIATNMKMAAQESSEAFKTGSQTIGESLSGLASKFQEFWNKYGSTIMNVVGQINDLFSQSFDNRAKRIDNYYTKERDAIERSKMTEEAKAAAIEKLDVRVDAQKRKLARDEAKRNKAAGIFQATISTAVAAVKALELGPIAGTIAAGIISALGAAQIAAIAAEPLPMATGGIFSGEHNVKVGEYAGASFNPEVISPLDKLQGMIQSTMRDIHINLKGTWEASGDQLRSVLNYAYVNHKRLSAD